MNAARVRRSECVESRRRASSARNAGHQRRQAAPRVMERLGRTPMFLRDERVGCAAEQIFGVVKHARTVPKRSRPRNRVRSFFITKLNPLGPSGYGDRTSGRALVVRAGPVEFVADIAPARTSRSRGGEKAGKSPGATARAQR